MFIFALDSKVNNMANIRFIVRDMDSDTEQTIYVTSRFGRNEKLMYATPLKVEPIFWNEKDGRVKSSKYCAYRDEVNGALNAIEVLVKSFIAKAATSDNETVSKESLKNLLDIHFGKKKAKGGDFHSFFEDFIKQCDFRLSPRKAGQAIDYKTKREYARTYYYRNMKRTGK